MPSGQTPRQWRVPGFDLAPLDSLDSGTWAAGVHVATGTRVLARVVGGISSVDALAALEAIRRTVEGPPDESTPLAVMALTRDGDIVVASTAPDVGFGISCGPVGAGAADSADPVDVVALWADAGTECLAGADRDPHGACGRLAASASILDRLGADPDAKQGWAAAGALDGPSLRIVEGSPRLLGIELAGLVAKRRQRFDEPGALQAVPVECCMPPERAGGRSPQYALAALWSHARTGRAPFAAIDAGDVFGAKMASAPSLDELPAGERAVVARALSSAPEDRFGTSADFVMALEAALEPVPLLPPAVDAGPLPVAEPLPTPVESEPVPTVVPEAFVSRPPEPVVNSAQPLRRTDAAETGPLPEDAAAPAPEPPTSAVYTVALALPPYKPGDVIVPGYRLGKELGKGGCGKVWEASASGNVRAAIKVINRLGPPGAREYRAIQKVKDIEHDHIVKIKGVWLKGLDGRVLDEEEVRRVEEALGHPSPREATTAGSAATFAEHELVIAMDQGKRTLFQVLESHKQSLGHRHDGPMGLEPGRVLDWMKQAAEALDALNHGKKKYGFDMQHCDIKPQNLLLFDSGSVKVCDFGLTRALDDPRTTTNHFATLIYAAPELIDGPREPSPTTDQYSLAVTYHELRTGYFPYEGQVGRTRGTLDALEIWHAKREGALDLSLLGREEGGALGKALAVDPEARYGSCGELIDALREAIEEDARRPTRDADSPAGASGSAWNRLCEADTVTRAKILGGGLAIVLLVGFVLFGGSGRTPGDGDSDPAGNQPGADTGALKENATAELKKALAGKEIERAVVDRLVQPGGGDVGEGIKSLAEIAIGIASLASDTTVSENFPSSLDDLDQRLNGQATADRDIVEALRRHLTAYRAGKVDTLNREARQLLDTALDLSFVPELEPKMDSTPVDPAAIASARNNVSKARDRGELAGAIDGDPATEVGRDSKRLVEEASALGTLLDEFEGLPTVGSDAGDALKSLAETVFKLKKAVPEKTFRCCLRLLGRTMEAYIRPLPKYGEEEKNLANEYCDLLIQWKKVGGCRDIPVDLASTVWVKVITPTKDPRKRTISKIWLEALDASADGKEIEDLPADRVHEHALAWVAWTLSASDQSESPEQERSDGVEGRKIEALISRIKPLLESAEGPMKEEWKRLTMELEKWLKP
jgi:serine/threonine protein kinase